MGKYTSCIHLSDIVSLNDFNGDYFQYEKYLMKVFNEDLYSKNLFFLGKPVFIRNEGQRNGLPGSFIHLTNCDYQKQGFVSRQLDIRRSERLHWIKPILANVKCKLGCCSGIKIWEEKRRIEILFEEEYYLIVLERRKNYFLLVTAYYVEYDNEMDRLLKRYMRAKTKDAQVHP